MEKGVVRSEGVCMRDTEDVSMLDETTSKWRLKNGR